MQMNIQDTYSGTKFQKNNLVSAVRHLLLFVLISALCWITPQISHLDLRFNDIVLQLDHKAGSDQIVLLEIGQEAVNQSGSFPVSRSYLAKILQQIAKVEPKRVLLDGTFVAQGAPEVDQQFADALSAFPADGFALIGLNARGSRDAVRPNPAFAEKATIVAGELLIDRDGFARSMKTRNDGNAIYSNPARWLAGQPGFAPVLIDQEIDPNTYRRHKLSQLTPQILTSLKDKIIIIGQSPTIGAGFVNYPMNSQITRQVFFALGADTLLSGTERQIWERYQAAGLTALIGLFAFITVHLAQNRRQIIILSVSGTLLTIGVNYAGLIFFDTLMRVLFCLAIWNIGITIALLHKYRFIEAAKEIFSGDLSPEEAWAWRTMDSYQEPVVLLGLSGLKRANDAARRIGISEQNPAAIRELRRALENNEMNVARSFHILRKRYDLILSQPFGHIPLVQIRDVSAELREKRRVEMMLETDSMTGCKNRQGFETALSSFDNSNIDFAVFMMDMNGFKAANDTYGHAAGDAVLVEAARRFQSILREGDVLARLGGDEFGIIAGGRFSQAHLLGYREGLEAVLAEPIIVGGQTIPIGVAVGFATSMDFPERNQLLEAADQTMYARKLYLKSQDKAAQSHNDRANQVA